MSSLSQEDKELLNRLNRQPNLKKRNVVVHQEKICPVKKAKLPKDAVCKEDDTVVIQDIIIRAENTAFKWEAYYSASEKKRIIGALPLGYQETGKAMTEADEIATAHHARLIFHEP